MMVEGRVRCTNPIEHGLGLGRQGGQGVAVVGLAEHLEHGRRLPLLTGAAHGGGARLGAQLVEAGPGGDAVGEPGKFGQTDGIEGGHLRVQVTSRPVRSLSFRRSVTLSTFSMFDTK